MSPSLREFVEGRLAGLDIEDPQFAVEAVAWLLAAGRSCGASDLHLQPTAAGLEMLFRIDGVLQLAGTFPAKVAANIIARLKVLADLLTYRSDVPQEGRIRQAQSDIEMRVSTFPTLYGERTVVRFFAGGKRYERLEDLGFPLDVLEPVSYTHLTLPTIYSV